MSVDQLLGVEVRGKIHQLLDTVEAGDAELAKTIIAQLYRVCADNTVAWASGADLAMQPELYQALGKLTRSLHESLKDFNAGEHFLDMAGAQLPDVRARLKYVIDKTKEAADKTMDKIELVVPIAAELKKESSELLADWEKIARREISGAEFREIFKHAFRYLQETQTKTSELHTHLTDVIVAQDFQDLTGQVLTKVIQLVTELEDNLLRLITLSGHTGHSALSPAPQSGTAYAAPAVDKSKAPEGPQIAPGTRKDVVSGQDEVDALLSSLGF